MTKYVGAIDQGTTSTRFMIFDHEGKVVGIDQKEHEQIYPKPGWVEHNPLEIWERCQEVMKGALAKYNLKLEDLAAIGITNQRETTVVWEKATGKPVYNAIVWQDTRTDTICNDLAKDGGQDRFRTKVGLPLATYFSGPKVKWILDNVEGARAKAEKGEVLFGNIDTWVIWNLTGGPNGGVHVTDVTNASRTMLMNLETLDWDPDMLKVMGIPKAMLPAIKASSEVYGSVGGVPVAGDLGDQQAALFGQTCFSPGEAKNTYGTGCFMLLNTGTKPVQSKNGLLTTLGYKIGNQAAVYCPGRLHRHYRRVGAVAARQPAHVRLLQARGRLCARRGRQRRHLHRPRVLRPVCAVLEEQCARRHRGPDPLHQQGPHCARGAGSHRVSDPRSAGCDERRFRRAADGAEG